jgi:tetratricopeptide (TPR) repeat protein
MNQRPRRVGIHGVRSAGKTCFLGSLYGFRSTDALKLDVADDASCRYLSAVWKELSEGRTPGATMLALPETLRLDLTAADRTTPLELCDYAGLLVQPRDEQASPAAHELTAEVKAWLRGCHAVLLFLDCTQPDMEQIDALDLLLTELRRPTPEGGVLDRPLGLVLTKWDSQGVIGDDLEREQERARAFLQSHHVFRQIFTKLGDEEGRHVRIFPVSSFGNQARGDQPPELSHYRPCHLHAPLMWAAEASDHTLFEEARHKAESHLARWWPDHAAARREWLNLRREAVTLTPDIDDELTALAARRGRDRLHSLVPVAVLVALLGLGGVVGAREAAARADDVLTFAAANSAYNEAAERLEHCEAFLATWWSRLVPARRQEIAERAESDRRAVAEQAERSEFLDRLTAHERAAEWADALAAVRDYLTRYPETPIGESLRAREKEAAEQDAHNRALADGAVYERQGRFADAAACYRHFLAEYPATRWKADLDDRIRDANRYEEDQGEYAVIRQLVRDGGGASLDEAGRKALAYLESRAPVRAMRAEVERFRSWLDGLRRGGEYKVVIESVQVMPGCSLLPTIGVTHPQVHVTLNGVTHRSGWLRGSNTTPGVEVGPFPFKFGEPGKLLVRVEASRNFTRNPWARVEFADPRFILGKANTTVVALCEKGGEVRLGLRCEAAMPPELPTYRRR